MTSGTGFSGIIRQDGAKRLFETLLLRQLEQRCAGAGRQREMMDWLGKKYGIRIPLNLTFFQIPPRLLKIVCPSLVRPPVLVTIFPGKVLFLLANIIASPSVFHHHLKFFHYPSQNIVREVRSIMTSLFDKVETTRRQH